MRLIDLRQQLRERMEAQPIKGDLMIAPVSRRELLRLLDAMERVEDDLRAIAEPEPTTVSALQALARQALTTLGGRQ